METMSYAILKIIPPSLRVLLTLKFTYGNKLEERLFDDSFKSIFNSIVEYICHYGFKKSKIASGKITEYCYDIKKELRHKKGYYHFNKGEIESKLFHKLLLPTEFRFNKFLSHSYMYVEGIDSFFKYVLFKERIRRYLTKSKTIYHYLSIPGWRNLNYTKLIEKVKTVDKIEVLWNEKYNITNLQDFSERSPAIAKTIDIVLQRGKISEKTIFNLASSEKLLFIHKYAEGFGEVYNQQNELRAKLTEDINKWKKSKALNAKRKLINTKAKRQELLNNWVRAPLNTIIEQKGFQKLFNKMDGVYILPISMIPEKYHNKEIDFIQEEIIIEAQKYLNDLSGSDENHLTLPDELKYILVSNVIKVNDLNILSHGRNIEISSPGLSKMLLTSYFANDNSNVSNIYINDLIRNVEFLSRFNQESKTYKYFKKNFEKLKLLLWLNYKIDLYRSIQLIGMTDTQFQELSEELYNHDSSLSIRYILGALRDSRVFYAKLNAELDKFKK